MQSPHSLSLPGHDVVTWCTDRGLSVSMRESLGDVETAKNKSIFSVTYGA
jgi:hypothetical protein